MKTNKKHFEIFKMEFTKRQKEFGLIGYDSHILHQYIDPNTVSEIHINQEARNFIVILNTKWEDIEKVSSTSLKNSALHEVLELLLNKIESFACESKKEQAREEAHVIIQTLINVVGV
jgi:hypothetical protein